MEYKVSSELRAVEREIDNYYNGNPLIKLPFGTAAWYLLAFFEDLAFRESMPRENYSIYNSFASADYLVKYV